MSTLYDLTNEFKELLFLAETEDLDEQTLADTLESLGYELEDKADGYAKVIRELEGQALILKSEIDRLNNRKKTIESNIKQMKKSLQDAMKSSGKTKFKTDLFSFNIAKNGGKQALDIYDKVPKEYSVVKLEPDKDKIRQVLEKGEELPFAILQERGESLRIR